MWLLDHNVPHQLVSTLNSIGIPCETAINRGWNTLQNGELLSAASQSGFTCLLTRDFLFGESAIKAMRSFPKISIVLLTIPQSKGDQYAEQFLKYWKKSPIHPKPQKIIRWPFEE